MILAIQFTCDLCNYESNESGGLIISPPFAADPYVYYKFHICRGCYDKIMVKLEIDEETGRIITPSDKEPDGRGGSSDEIH